MPGFVKVAKTSEIAPASSKAVEVNGKKIALFNVDGSFFAMEDNCNHKGGPLSQGPIEGETVTCPWHGAVFDIKTGKNLKFPAVVPMQTYNVRVVGEQIEVEA